MDSDVWLEAIRWRALKWEKIAIALGPGALLLSHLVTSYEPAVSMHFQQRVLSNSHCEATVDSPVNKRPQDPSIQPRRPTEIPSVI